MSSLHYGIREYCRGIFAPWCLHCKRWDFSSNKQRHEPVAILQGHWSLYVTHTKMGHEHPIFHLPTPCWWRCKCWKDKRAYIVELEVVHSNKQWTSLIIAIMGIILMFWLFFPQLTRYRGTSFFKFFPKKINLSSFFQFLIGSWMGWPADNCAKH